MEVIDILQIDSSANCCSSAVIWNLTFGGAFGTKKREYSSQIVLTVIVIFLTIGVQSHYH